MAMNMRHEEATDVRRQLGTPLQAGQPITAA